MTFIVVCLVVAFLIGVVLIAIHCSKYDDYGLPKVSSGAPMPTVKPLKKEV